ncbi:MULTISPECIES: hypothetical protein [unclassified Microbacterium]|uniref:hypothetical protein n=1 Tax=unclassified Microbacterium TaxID=2609290 RepID=UPI0011B037F4|nr:MULTISPECIES: hypothetical protein [unclassified Microbacterium]
MELFAEIRRASGVEGFSMNALAKRFGVHRRMIRQALASPFPPERKAPERRAPKLGAFQPLIDDWLRENLTAPKKQSTLQTSKCTWGRL